MYQRTMVRWAEDSTNYRATVASAEDPRVMSTTLNCNRSADLKQGTLARKATGNHLEDIFPRNHGMYNYKEGPQSRAPLRWGEGAKNTTANRHHGCPNYVPHSKELVGDEVAKMGKENDKSKPHIRIGTWNARTMLVRGKLENVKREMERNKVNVMGLSEVRWQGNGDFYSDEYRVIYAGGSESQKGVAVILDGEAAKRVTEVDQRSDRMMLVKLQSEPVDIAIIQVYMPTSAHDEQEVDDM